KLGGRRAHGHGRLSAGTARQRPDAGRRWPAAAPSPVQPAATAAASAKGQRMKIVRRLIYKEVLSAVAFVSLGFLALFFFFDLLDEMRSVGRVPGYTLSYALMAVALEIPNHL